MSKSEYWDLKESPPGSPEHGSDVLGTASEAVPAAEPPPPAPEAPEVAPPVQLSAELLHKEETLQKLAAKAIASVRARPLRGADLKSRFP